MAAADKALIMICPAIPYPRSIIKKFYFYFKFRAYVHSRLVSYDNILGERVIINPRCIVSFSTIGSHTFINCGAEIYNTDMDKYCSIGEHAKIGLYEHDLDLITTSKALYSREIMEEQERANAQRTLIGPDVWVGAQSIIRKGCEVGVGAVIGASAVVTKDVPPYAVVAGVPAKILRYRFNEVEISQLLQSRWWELPYESIKTVIGNVRPKKEDGEINKICEKIAHIRAARWANLS